MKSKNPGISMADLTAQVADLLANGGRIADIHDLSAQDLEVIYALGHRFYEQGQYAQAMQTFGFLVMHDHMERRFIGAFAASLQMMGSYREAIDYHTLSSVMDLTDPAPTFHTSECLLALGKRDDAREGLEMTIAQCSTEAHATLKARAQGMLDLLRATAGKGTPQTAEAA